MVNPQDLSELFDGEIEQSKLTPLLSELAANPTARERWTRLSMISDAMAGVAWPDDGYSRRLFARLRDVAIDPEYDPLKP
jgi:negative regulator of sigma E activity